MNVLPKDIATKLDVSIGSLETSCWKYGVVLRRRMIMVHAGIANEIHLGLVHAARKAGITKEELISSLLSVIITDDMVEAVLDVGADPEEERQVPERVR